MDALCRLPTWLVLLALGACSGAEVESPLGAPEPQISVWPRAEVERDLKLELNRFATEPFEQGLDPKLQTVLRNDSKDRAYSVVMPGDGSESGLREPHAWFALAVRRRGEAFHGPPPVHYARCGLYDEDWQKDVVTLGPGESRILPWMGFRFRSELDGADEIAVTAHYSYGEHAKDRRSLAPTLHGMPAFAVESRPLVLAIDRPVALRLELHGALPRRPGQPLSSIVSVTATNVSKRAVPFATVASGASLRFELELTRSPEGGSKSFDVPSHVPFSETEEQLPSGASRDAFGSPAVTTGIDWQLSPEEHVRRIRAIFEVAADGGSYAHTAASPWVDVAEP